MYTKRDLRWQGYYSVSTNWDWGIFQCPQNGIRVKFLCPHLWEPYPGRWTHHVLIAGTGEIDDELMGWVKEAAAFSDGKR